MIRIIKARKENKLEMSKLFVNSFYNLFKSFCSDKNKLYYAFKDVFNLNNFYIVLLDEKIIGMAACCDGHSSIRFSLFALCRYLGIKTGKILYYYLKQVIIERDYSFEMDEQCGMLEWVCVDEEYQNRGIGYTLINHVICDNNYVRYLAKVADNNQIAKRLFEKVLFEEFDVDEASLQEKKDLEVNNYLYLIYSK